MAVVSQSSIRLKNGQDFKIIVKYSKQRFTIELPDVLCSDMKYTDKEHCYVQSDTEVKVIALFHSKLNEWNKCITNKTKVIVFEAKFNGAKAHAEYRKTADNGKYKPHYYREGYVNDSYMFEFCGRDIEAFNSSSLGMLIRWAVYAKETVGDKHGYTCISGRPFDSSRLKFSGKGIVEIEWTEQREQFFLRLDEAFATMISNVHSALGDLTPEKLEKLTEGTLNILQQKNS